MNQPLSQLLSVLTRRLCSSPLTRSALHRPAVPHTLPKLCPARSLTTIVRQQCPGISQVSSINTTTPQAIQMTQTEVIPRLLCVNTATQVQQSRTKVFLSWKRGKPKSVLAVTKRFKRLGNGLWIRTRAGRRKKLWKKSLQQRKRAKGHVFCNKRQSWLLERMVGKYWRRHRHFPDDPYAPYHVRNDFRRDRVYTKAPFYP